MNDVLVFDGEPTVLVEQTPGDIVVFDPALSPVQTAVPNSDDFLIFDAAGPLTTVVTPPGDFVIVDGAPVTVLALDTGETDFLVIETRGPQGPRGIDGLRGIDGSPGTAGGSFIFIQSVPSTLWDITHNLTYTPNVFVVDSAGTVMFGDVHWVSSTNITITFSVPVSGFAYLS